MFHELVVEWSNGDKNVYRYRNKELAEKGVGRFRMAFGEQVKWAGVRPVYSWQGVYPCDVDVMGECPKAYQDCTNCVAINR